MKFRYIQTNKYITCPPPSPTMLKAHLRTKVICKQHQTVLDEAIDYCNVNNNHQYISCQKLYQEVKKQNQKNIVTLGDRIVFEKKFRENK